MDMNQKCDALLDWFVYRNPGNPLPDRDVSLEQITEYAELCGFPKEWICPQNKNSQYEIHIPGSHDETVFRGDTMTSVWTRLREYLEAAAQKGQFHWNKELFTQNSRGKFQRPEFARDGFKIYFFKLMSLNPELYKSVAEPEDKRNQLLRDMCEALPDSFFDFLIESEKSGNMIICPEHFNGPRGRKASGKYDTKDYIAFCFARYFKTGNPKELRKLGSIDIDKLLVFFDILQITNLEQCKEKLYLQDLFDKDGLVISLRTGEGISEDCERYNPRPQSIEEYECFFRLDAQITAKRRERISRKIRNR